MRACVFCRIRDGEVPAQIVHRDEYCLGFQDIRPRAPVHVLFIPLRHIETLNDLSLADSEQIGHLVITATQYAKQLGFAERGYRLVWNCNLDAGQTIFHIHLHLLAGRPMGWPPG